MAAIGWIAVGVVAAAMLAGVLVGVRSIPDVQLYLKMRRM
jgi:hypothetical protein